MNISCEIIRDLLPLYKQNKCCTQSTALVEEHIKHCSKCKKEFTAMTSENEVKNINFFRIEQKLKKENRNKLVKAGGIGFALAFVVFYVFPMLF